MVVGKMVWFLLKLIGTSCISPDCLLYLEQKLVSASLVCLTLMIYCRVYTGILLHLVSCLLFVFLYQLSLVVVHHDVYLDMLSELSLYDCLLVHFLSLCIYLIYQLIVLGYNMLDSLYLLVYKIIVSISSNSVFATSANLTMFWI